jgi:hypothetical protein
MESLYDGSTDSVTVMRNTELGIYVDDSSECRRQSHHKHKGRRRRSYYKKHCRKLELLVGALYQSTKIQQKLLLAAHRPGIAKAEQESLLSALTLIQKENLQVLAEHDTKHKLDGSFPQLERQITMLGDFQDKEAEISSAARALLIQTNDVIGPTNQVIGYEAIPPAPITVGGTSSVTLAVATSGNVPPSVALNPNNWIIFQLIPTPGAPATSCLVGAPFRPPILISGYSCQMTTASSVIADINAPNHYLVTFVPVDPFARVSYIALNSGVTGISTFGGNPFAATIYNPNLYDATNGYGAIPTGPFVGPYSSAGPFNSLVGVGPYGSIGPVGSAGFITNPVSYPLYRSATQIQAADVLTAGQSPPTLAGYQAQVHPALPIGILANNTFAVVTSNKVTSPELLKKENWRVYQRVPITDGAAGTSCSAIPGVNTSFSLPSVDTSRYSCQLSYANSVSADPARPGVYIINFKPSDPTAQLSYVAFVLPLNAINTGAAIPATLAAGAGAAVLATNSSNAQAQVNLNDVKSAEAPITTVGLESPYNVNITDATFTVSTSDDIDPDILTSPANRTNWLVYAQAPTGSSICTGSPAFPASPFHTPSLPDPQQYCVIALPIDNVSKIQNSNGQYLVQVKQSSPPGTIFYVAFQVNPLP